MNFEEIIAEHNDELVYIFSTAGENPEKPLSHFGAIVDATNDLNRRTEEKLAAIFDKTFLDNHAIEEKPKKN